MIETLERFDRDLLLLINSIHTPLLDVFMWYTSEVWPTVLFVFFAAFIFSKKYGFKKAVEFLLGCALVLSCTDLSSNAIKHGVKRYRPTHNLEIQKQVHIYNEYSGGQYGFVSGHSANTFGAVTYIFFCLHWIRIKYRSLIFIYPALVTYSRMYLGVHYPSDIFVGMLLGVIFASIGYYLVNRFFFKFNAKAI